MLRVTCRFGGRFSRSTPKRCYERQFVRFCAIPDEVVASVRLFRFIASFPVRKELLSVSTGMIRASPGKSRCGVRARHRDGFIRFRACLRVAFLRRVARGVSIPGASNEVLRLSFRRIPQILPAVRPN